MAGLIERARKSVNDLNNQFWLGKGGQVLEKIQDVRQRAPKVISSAANAAYNPRSQEFKQSSKDFATAVRNVAPPSVSQFLEGTRQGVGIGVPFTNVRLALRDIYSEPFAPEARGFQQNAARIGGEILGAFAMPIKGGSTKLAKYLPSNFGGKLTEKALSTLPYDLAIGANQGYSLESGLSGIGTNVALGLLRAPQGINIPQKMQGNQILNQAKRSQLGKIRELMSNIDSLSSSLNSNISKSGNKPKINTKFDFHPDDVTLMEQISPVLFDKKYVDKAVAKGLDISKIRTKATEIIDALSETYLSDIEKDNIIQKVAKRTKFRNNDDTIRKEFFRTLLKKAKDAPENISFYDPNVPVLGFAGTQKPKQQTIQSTTPILDRLTQSTREGRGELGTKIPTLQDIKGKASDLRTKFKTEITDKLAPIEDLANKVKGLSNEENPYVKMRLYAGLSGKIDSALQEIKPVLQLNKNNLDDLDNLLKIDRMKEKSGQGLATQLKPDEIAQAYNELASKYGSEGFKQLQNSAQQIRNFGGKLLDRLYNSGIIDENSYKSIKANNEFYVPFEIVDYMTDNLEQGNISNSFNVASQNVIKTMKGSEKAVASPLDAIVRKAGKVIALTEKNNVVKSLVDLKDRPELKGLITEGDVAQKGFGKINLFINGENKSYIVPDYIETVVKNLDAKQAGLIGKVLAVPATILRTGATGLNIAFIPANIVRDFTDAVASQGVKDGIGATLKFLGSYPKAFASAIGKDDLYYKWLQSGGSGSTFTKAEVLKAPQETVKRLAGKESLFKKVISSPKDAIEFAGRVAEESTRLAKFKSELDSGKSLSEAALKSRDITLDFARSGNSVKVLNQVVPFLNAAVQGSAKMMSLVKDNPKEFSIMAGSLIGAPTFISYLHNRQFQDYKDLADYEKETNWILIARDRTPEERSSNAPLHAIKIPKGNILKPLSNALESMYGYFDQEDPKALDQVALDFIEQISPVGLPIDADRMRSTANQFIPQIAKPVVEQITNQNLFTGRQIVPDKLLKLNSEEQYDETTPMAAIKLGQLTGLSPKRIESVFSTAGGGVGKQILQPTKVLTDTVGRFSAPRGGEEYKKYLENQQSIEKDITTRSYRAERAIQENLGSNLKQKLKEDISNGKYTRDDVINILRNKQKLSKIIASEANKISDPDEKKNYLRQIRASGLIDKKVMKYLKVELALSRSDKALKGKSVRVRAALINNELGRLTDNEARLAYFKALKDKKILTEDVAREITLIRNNQK